MMIIIVYALWVGLSRFKESKSTIWAEIFSSSSVKFNGFALLPTYYSLVGSSVNYFSRSTGDVYGVGLSETATIPHRSELMVMVLFSVPLAVIALEAVLYR